MRRFPKHREFTYSEYNVRAPLPLRSSTRRSKPINDPFAARRCAARSRGTTRHGAAVVELVVCIVPLFVLVFATIDVCQLLYAKQDALVVAFEGVRCRSAKNCTTEEARSICQRMLTDRGIRGASVTFRFPQGERAGQLFEVEIRSSHGQLGLPFSVVGSHFSVSRFGVLD